MPRGIGPGPQKRDKVLEGRGIGPSSRIMSQEPEPDKMPEQIPSKLYADHHPKLMREGLVEKLVKYMGRNYGTLMPEDNEYLEQYLHPELDIIPKQRQRPTQLSKMPDMEFRRVPTEEANVLDKPAGFVPNAIGLGNYIKGEGKDYNSAYDIWDFDTDSSLAATTNDEHPEKTTFGKIADYAAKKIMQQVGTPFAVYERYPKEEKYAEYGGFPKYKTEKKKK